MKDKQLRQIWEKTNGHCHFCGDPVDFDKHGWNDGDLKGFWEVDHVYQRGKGGTNSVENSLPACTRCNRLRWHRTGDRIRELILLGLVAKNEIKKSSSLGKSINLLMEKRSVKTINRRKLARS